MPIAYSYEKKLGVKGTDILLGSSPTEKNQTKNFPIDAIKEYMQFGSWDSVDLRLPIFLAVQDPTYGEVFRLVPSLLKQDASSQGTTSVGGSKVTIDNGYGLGDLDVAKNISSIAGDISTQAGNLKIADSAIVGGNTIDQNYKLKVIGDTYIDSSLTVNGLSNLNSGATLNNYRITDVQNPVDPQDAATKSYVDANGDKTFVYTKGNPDTLWTITHNLNKFPSVTVVNINNIRVEGEVEYVDLNILKIKFSAGFSGKAYMN